MRHEVALTLFLVALIHAMPAIGLIGAGRLSALYGIAVEEPNLELLLRHRAVLFGLLAAFLAYAAVHPELHRIALTAGFVSVASFLILAHLIGGHNAALLTVVRVDWFALAVLIAGTAVHCFYRG
jgi:hypothetical protein